jgi:ubiquinone/menaquinone biosynthesis C-methylase UbiE
MHFSPMLKNKEIPIVIGFPVELNKIHIDTSLHGYDCRGVEEYEKELGITAKSLDGKHVLDIGSGHSKFSLWCKEFGVDFLCLDPRYREVMQLNAKDKIAGVNEVLPFRNSSFDAILSCYSSFFYLNEYYRDKKLRKEAAKAMFKEVFRVLKPQGKAYICAFWGEGKEFINTTLTQIVRDSGKISWSWECPDRLTLVITKCSN